MGGKKPKQYGKGDGAKINRLPAIQFEDFAAADRTFRELLEGPDYLPDSSQAEDDDDVGSSNDRKARKKRGKSGGGMHTVDMHGLTLQEAIERLDTTISVALAALAQPVTLKIVTGKGLHSGPGGGVLAREIHRHVSARYGPIIDRLDASPAETSLGGVPMRGYFTVTFRRNAGK